MIKKLALAASVLGAALGTFALAGPAQATLIGDSVTVRIAVPLQGPFDETGSTTVTADASDAFELTKPGNNLVFRVDPFDAGLVVTLLQGGFAFGVPSQDPTVIEFSDLQWQGTPGRVTGASIVENFSLNLGLITDITFTDSSVRVALTRLRPASWSAGDVLTINLETAHALPEPASLALFGVGLLSLGVAVRRRHCLAHPHLQSSSTPS